MRPTNYNRIHDALCRLSLLETLVGASPESVVFSANDLYGFSQIIEDAVSQIRQSIDLEGSENDCK